MSLSSTPLTSKFRQNKSAPVVEPVDIAQQITDWYHNQVFSGNTEQYGNGPLSVNKGAFYAALAPAYVDTESSTKSANENQLDIIASAHQSASIAYWSGAQMQKASPPPGADSIITNQVINPGSFSVDLPDINSTGGYVGLLTSAHEQHLLTIQGNITARMPNGSVQNFPWTGIN